VKSLIKENEWSIYKHSNTQMPFIYALRNRTSDLVYYGSTKADLKSRLQAHKSSYNQNKNTTSKQIVKCPTAYIELLEEVSVEDRFVRERWWIENNPCVNQRIPNHTEEDRKRYLRDYCKNYYHAHKV
jgi:predicted GIY-YIG superfamily endonuclease